MATIYVRDVPDEVTETLKTRAAQAGQSLSSYVANQLSLLAARPSPVDLLARFEAIDRTSGPTRDEILEALHESRR